MKKKADGSRASLDAGRLSGRLCVRSVVSSANSCKRHRSVWWGECFGIEQAPKAMRSPVGGAGRRRGVVWRRLTEVNNSDVKWRMN
jgi:hypothetical protein